MLQGFGSALVFASVNEFGLGVVVATDVFAAQGAAATHAATRAVDGGGGGVNDHGLMLVEQACAEVVVFVVEEELLVKELPAKSIHSQQHGGAAHKANAGRAFGDGRAATAPEQVGPTVVDFGRAAGLQQLGRHHGRVGPGVGRAHQLLHGLRCDFAVGVEQEGKWGLHLRQCAVVGRAKAQVAGQRQNLGVGQVLRCLLRAAVVAAVVDHDDMREAGKRNAQCRQAVGAVEGHGDDRDLME